MMLSRERLRVVGVIHRKSREERVDFFLAYRLEGDGAEPQNREPEKCSELVWANLGSLPDDTIQYVRAGIENFKKGTWFQEFGWEPVWSNDAVQPPGRAMLAPAADRGRAPQRESCVARLGMGGSGACYGTL